jgi:hypothetical protein
MFTLQAQKYPSFDITQLDMNVFITPPHYEIHILSQINPVHIFNIFTYYPRNKSRDSVGGIANGYGLDYQEVGV